MPNLENLRKQARQIVRWHRERYYPVAAQIRTGLARFSNLSDPTVFDAAFKLCDAQELVARKHGFESWPALVKGLKTMNSSEPVRTKASTLIAAEPQLFTADIDKACRFYVDTLGFAVAFSYGEPPFYAQVVRDGARLNLRQAVGPVSDTRFGALEPDALSATLTTEDARSLFLEFKAAGAPLRQTLRTEPWGWRTFIVEDPDGNLIAFAGGATG